MTNFYSLKDFADGPHMVVDPKGKWAWAADLAAARSEIERLTKERDYKQMVIEKLSSHIEKAEAERDSFQAMFRSCLKGNDALREKAQKANTERDEARALVASIWKGPGETPHRYSPDYMAQGDCQICGHTREAHQSRP